MKVLPEDLIGILLYIPAIYLISHSGFQHCNYGEALWGSVIVEEELFEKNIDYVPGSILTATDLGGYWWRGRFPQISQELLGT